MNRHNIWIHIALASVLVGSAAVLGQMERWRSSLKSNADVTPNATATKRDGNLLPPKPAKNGAAEVLVRFKPGTTMDRIRQILSANHDELIDETESVPGLTAIDDLDNADIGTLVAQYRDMPDVAYAEANYQIKLDDPIQKEKAPSGKNPFAHDLLLREKDPSVYMRDELERTSPLSIVPTDPMFDQQWALNNDERTADAMPADIDALRAWENSKGSSDVVVAVLDSGVDYNHPDLKNNIWTRPQNIAAYTDDELGTFNDLHGYNGTDKLRDPMDDNGHGTHCAGIIGAEGGNGIGIVGVNWHVQIMPLKFLNSIGMGTTEDVIEAINYAIDRKKAGVNLRVISASFGSNEYSQALEDTIRAAGDAGILVVAAAGNDGTNNDSWPHYPSNFDLPNIISVAALDRNDQLASFSNFGKKTVHIAAPGKDILSTYLGGDYRELSGTSMATPFVSGVGALIVAQNPDISMLDLRKRLLSSVDKLPQLKGKVESGGRLCAFNALKK